MKVIENPYKPTQVIECRGPCGDSGCPHKPKPPWWQEFLVGLGVTVGLGTMLAGLAYLLDTLGIKAQ